MCNGIALAAALAHIIMSENSWCLVVTEDSWVYDTNSKQQCNANIEQQRAKWIWIDQVSDEPKQCECQWVKLCSYDDSLFFLFFFFLFFTHFHFAVSFSSIMLLVSFVQCIPSPVLRRKAKFIQCVTTYSLKWDRSPND